MVELWYLVGFGVTFIFASRAITKDYPTENVLVIMIQSFGAGMFWPLVWIVFVLWCVTKFITRDLR